MEVRDIPLAEIRISEFNARKDLSAGTEDADIGELADSIRERGLLSPITVRHDNGGFELIAGQRRFLACRQLGMPSLSAIVRDDLDDTDATIISLVENVHRADMSPIDKARAYERIHHRYGSYTEVARQAGVSTQTVRRYLSLLNLEPELRDQLSTRDGPAGVGTLSKLAETFQPEEQKQVLDRIGGFKQGIQQEILKQSAGDIERVEDLRERALSGAFDTRLCRDGLCFEMPDEVKSIISSWVEEDLTGFETAIRRLARSDAPALPAPTQHDAPR